MKKIISLGGNYFQMTAVKAAKRLGYYVIDVDYLPDNPAHKYADKYYNVSTLDKEAVLEVAKKENIDGIISFASDVSAPTAAYVAEKLGLPTNPYETVDIMTRKDRFHPFLKSKGFYVPDSCVIEKEEDIEKFFDRSSADIMIKPINSSGSKGVSRVGKKEDIHNAYIEAQKYARGETIVAEEFFQRSYYQVAGDSFVVDGKIVFWGFANEHFDKDCNPLVPIGESFPADLTEDKIQLAKKELQRAITELGFKNGPINMDFMFTVDGKVLIIELAPRSGGNLITDAIKEACGIDLAEYAVKAALGEDMSDLKDVKIKNYVSSYIWHALEKGVYSNIDINEKLNKKIVLSDMFVEKGEEINRFENGGYGLGAALIKYENQEEMLDMMEHMNDYYKIVLE